MKIWHGKRLSSKMYGLEVEIGDIDNSVFNVPDHFFYFSGEVYQNFQKSFQINHSLIYFQAYLNTSNLIVAVL